MRFSIINLFLINKIILYMKTQYLNINEYKYKVDYITYDECNSLEKKQQQYIMLRNFSITNNVVVDDNIYFIEKSLFEQYKENCLINHNENKYLIFPSNKDTMYYSSEYHIFNDTYIDDDLINGTAVYELYEKKTKIVNNKIEIDSLDKDSKINCDLIKIYHPSIKSKENLIIHIENIINNIHFHYLCTKYQWYYNPENNNIDNQYNYNSIEEIRYSNNIYSEYIKCYIPSIKELFDRIIIDKDKYDYKWYFKENLNIVNTTSEENDEFIKNTIILATQNGETSQYVPITLFTQPFILKEYEEDKNQNEIIEPEEKIFKKLYFKYKISLDNSYITTPLNISLYPYISLNETTKIYTLSDRFLPGTTSLLNDYSFSLSSKIDFNDEGKISLLCYFDYPFKEKFIEKYKDAEEDFSLAEAYCFYNHVLNFNQIYVNNLKQIYFDELDEINSITDIDQDTIQFLIQIGMAEQNPTLTSEYPTTKAYYIAKLKESRWQVFLEEYKDEFKAGVDFFGFRIEIASDKYFKNIILSQNISLLDNSNINTLIENVINSSEENMYNIFSVLKNGVFFFPITGLFTDWKQMPDIVIARITFIDRFIGNELMSNEIFISKEKFKYITNLDIKRVNQLVELNKNYNNDMIELNLNYNYAEEEFNKIINENSDISDLKSKMVEWYNKFGKNHYSFINKINCKIENTTSDKTNIEKNNNTNVIYKPIFFKTNKLVNVSIKYRQNQNIGIDLHEYMSKVNLFILSLDGNTYYEIGRNVNFVLFNINANNIQNESGSFEIYNDNHEYITYGFWSMIR